MIAQSGSVISSALAPDEELIWSGHPLGGLRLQASDALGIPLSVCVAGFTFFWEVSVVRNGTSLILELWGIPLMAASLYLLVGRFFYDAALRANTYYGLTNRRVIIMTTLFGANEKSVPLDQMDDIDLSVGNDRRGTITFGTPLPFFASPFGFGLGTPPGPPALTVIENAQDVYDLIQTARRAPA